MQTASHRALVRVRAGANVRERQPRKTERGTATHDRSTEGGALHRSEKVDRDFVVGKTARDRPDHEPDHAGDKDPVEGGQLAHDLGERVDVKLRTCFL